MKKIFIYVLFIIYSSATFSQDDVYPAKENNEIIYIKNATIHIGNGQIIENGTIKIVGSKIERVGTLASVSVNEGAKIIDAKSKHIYPGLILSNSDLGLKEIVSGVRGTNDYKELGEMNPSLRSIVAYNIDSKVIGTLRANGILLANVVPEGGIISGSSSIVQLDAWNWEDAAYKWDNGIHFNMPSLLNTLDAEKRAQTSEDPVKTGFEKIEMAKSFFREAKAYISENNHIKTNLKYEAVKGLFNKQQKLFVHCNIVKEMLAAIDFSKEFGFEVVIVGGSESYQIADLLKQNNIAVILNELHSLPTAVDDDVDQPFKTPATLQRAGVLFAINDNAYNARYRNLAFNAGTAAAYGLSKEEALSAITLNAAKILGIADKTGSLEAGKDANIVICEGDILDMKSSIVTQAFIQGRQVSLDNKQKQLYERYKYKYNIK